MTMTKVKTAELVGAQLSYAIGIVCGMTPADAEIAMRHPMKNNAEKRLTSLRQYVASKLGDVVEVPEVGNVPD